MIIKKLSISATWNITGRKTYIGLKWTKRKTKNNKGEKLYKLNYMISYMISTPQGQKTGLL